MVQNHIDSAYARCRVILIRLRKERLKNLSAFEKELIRTGERRMPRISTKLLKGSDRAHFRTLGLRLYANSKNRGCCEKTLCELNKDYVRECHDDEDRTRLIQRALAYTRMRLTRESK